MDQNVNSYYKAEYDDSRFPKKWQAMLGCSLMQVFAYSAVICIMLVLGMNYKSLFRTSFGNDMFMGTVSQFIVVLLIPLLILSIGKKDFFATVRMKKTIDFVQILLLVISSAGIFFAAQGVNGIFVLKLESIFGAHSDVAEIEDASNLTQLIFEFFAVAMLPAFCEEIFFRGMVMRSFERTSTVTAVIVSSVTFSLMHGNATQFVYALIIGIILGTVTMISDSVFAGATIHFTLNAISAFISYPPVYDVFVDFTENNSLIFFITAYVILPAICFICLFLFILYSLKKNERKYGSSFVSEMDNVKLMKKQSSGEAFVTVICWAFFIATNIVTAVISWKGTI